MSKLTAAQQRALDWLPKSGEWRIGPGRLISALNSLSLYHRGVVEIDTGPIGPRRGLGTRARLTAAGVQEFAERTETS